jgi:hypothetical protein
MIGAEIGSLLGEAREKESPRFQSLHHDGV